MKKKKRKEKKNPKKIYRTSQNIRLVAAVRVLSLDGSHSPPHLPGMPSNTVLVSGPAVGAAQTLIQSYSSVLLPPVSTAIRTSAFSFVGAVSGLYIFHTQQEGFWQHQVLRGVGGSEGSRK